MRTGVVKHPASSDSLGCYSFSVLYADRGSETGSVGVGLSSTVTFSVLYADRGSETRGSHQASIPATSKRVLDADRGSEERKSVV